MPIQILMPALSPTMTEGTVANWVKSEGEEISSGEVLCEIETDKATMEVEAIDDGVLGKIIVAGGTQDVPVNSLIGIILEDGEDISALDLVNTAKPATIEKKEYKSTPIYHLDHNTEIDTAQVSNLASADLITKTLESILVGKRSI